MINRTILKMILFSLAAHTAVAAVIVYTPYEVTGSSVAIQSDKVIWGYLDVDMRHTHLKPSASTYRTEGVSVSPKAPGHEAPGMPKQIQGEFTNDTEKDVEYSAPYTEFISGSKIMIHGQDLQQPVQDDGADFQGSRISSEGADTANSANLSIADHASDRFYKIALADYLRMEIERHKYYPDAARSGGIEGTVYVNFYIGKDGAPSGISVARSSGSRILDDAGKKTIGMIGNISNMQNDLRGLDIEVPITYKLDK